MKIERTFRAEDSQLERWDFVVDEHVRRGLAKPNFSKIMRGFFERAIEQTTASLGDKKYILEMKKEARLGKRRESMRRLLSDLWLEDYNRKKISWIRERFGEKDWRVKEFEALVKEEMNDRGLRSSKKRLFQKTTLSIRKGKDGSYCASREARKGK